ncbi:MAG: FAD-binding protein [Chloroflexi bacterium]|nr:FAD-binding protein [Chloroflexota bacterium]
MLVRSVSWDRTVDVVVIGYGCAGPVAAITAAENGAEVLVLEKQPKETHHTNTSMAGGSFITPTDAKGALDFMRALCRITGGQGISWTGDSVLRSFAEYSATNLEWIEARGGSAFLSPGPVDYLHLPGADSLPKHRFKGLGVGLVKFLDGQVQVRKIPVLYQTRATHLLTNGRGRVIGVEAQTLQDGQNRKLRIGASRGVVLAPGGFEYDEQAKLQFLKVYPTYSSGSEANTGDGLRMAVEVGAQLWHMHCLSAYLMFKFPDFPIAFAPDYRGRQQLRYAKGDEAVPIVSGHIIVDGDGKRFTSENLNIHGIYYELPYFDSHRLIYPRVPSYLIFDRRRLENGPLPSVTVGPAGAARLYQWSADNSKEVERGWIKTANSIRGLTAKIGVPADNLDRTVKNFNRYCLKGHDPEFGRKQANLIALENPPYCAMQLWPGAPATMGGPQRNAKGQILGADGSPIPGLYGCGELGCIYGMLYPGNGGHLAQCFTSGRIAGENVIRERVPNYRRR